MVSGPAAAVRRILRIAPDQRGHPARDGQRGPGVPDDGGDLGPVPDDAGVPEQPGHVGRAESRHVGRVEAAERGPEVFPLAQDREPGQAGLEGFQAQPLENAPVIADRAAPLLVVIGELFRGGQRPRAAQLPVGPGLRRAARISHRGRRPLPRTGAPEPGKTVPAAPLRGRPRPVSPARPRADRSGEGRSGRASRPAAARRSSLARHWFPRVPASWRRAGLLGLGHTGPGRLRAGQQSGGDGRMSCRLADRSSASCWRSTAISTSRSVMTCAIRFSASSVTWTL